MTSRIIRVVAGVTLMVAALRAQAPPSIATMDAQLAELAIEAAARGPAVPIPLAGENGRVFGVVYDRYLLAVAIARSRIGEGASTAAIAIAQHAAWTSRGTVVVAYASDCEGRPNRPLAIRWQTSAQGPVSPSVVAGPMAGSDAQSLLPGVALPADAMVVNVRNALPIGASVAIDYSGPVCRGAATTAVLPIQNVPSMDLARGINGIKLPAELASLPSPTTVRLRVMLDATGRARHTEQVQGPPELGPAATAALNARKFPPATTNGIPTPATMLVAFVFTSTGEPGKPEPYAPTPPAGGNPMMVQRTEAVPVPPPPLAPLPPAPPGQIDQMLARLAAEVAQKGDPTPVPLDVTGPPKHGVIFDRFLVGAVKARAALRAGQPIDPAQAPASLVSDEDLIAVAYPLDCNGRSVSPIEIEMSQGGTASGPLRSTGDLLAGGALAPRLPGVNLPVNAAGRAFANASFAQNLEVRVIYSGPVCTGTNRFLAFPIQWVRGQGMPRPPAARLPPGSSLPSPSQVRLRGVVDLEGVYRYPTLADGPIELGPTAVTAASTWRYQPYRANGVAMPQVLVAPLSFTTSGMPEAAPAGPPAAGPPRTTDPPIVANTTVGGRSAGASTPDEPGLTRATSKCEIADDASYALTPAGAVKVGGEAFEGPARARRYLTALRGPAGQGLSYVRRGSTMANNTILDVYEISYAGLATPIRIFVDQYSTGPLKAPQGLVCAAPLK
jgi:hypothetical protein